MIHLFEVVVVNLDAGEKLGDVQRLQQDHDEDRWNRTNNLSKRYAGEAPGRQGPTIRSSICFSAENKPSSSLQFSFLGS
ncbi:hypothetical protein Tco_0737057 [Tanacetum coccineum]